MAGFFNNFFKSFFKSKSKKPNKQKQWQQKQQKQRQNKNHYAPKKLITYTEQKYYEAIKKAVSNDFILYPQINLASIIERTDKHKYVNELFRNVDFAIFDKAYNPILLIEINDKTHKERKRIERDKKVKEILAIANLPIVTFWTDYGVNQDYINKRIAEYITKGQSA